MEQIQGPRLGESKMSGNKEPAPIKSGKADSAQLVKVEGEEPEEDRRMILFFTVGTICGIIVIIIVIIAISIALTTHGQKTNPPPVLGPKILWDIGNFYANSTNVPPDKLWVGACLWITDTGNLFYQPWLDQNDNSQWKDWKGSNQYPKAMQADYNQIQRRGHRATIPTNEWPDEFKEELKKGADGDFKGRLYYGDGTAPAYCPLGPPKPPQSGRDIANTNSDSGSRPRAIEEPDEEGSNFVYYSKGFSLYTHRKRIYAAATHVKDPSKPKMAVDFQLTLTKS